MLGMYFLGDRKFELREMTFGEPAPHDVLIKVGACGVCGTDVHIYYGEKGSAEVTPPVVLGHEFAGVVEAVGKGVTSLKVGDHVTVDPNIYCGECEFCRAGKKQLCERLLAIGVTRDGGFAQYCSCPEAQCFLLDKDIPLSHGAMTEPLACCLHGANRVGIRQGDTVCVIGGGAIGLIMVQLARLSGASKVILSEPVQMRREIGLQLGADCAIDPFSENLQSRLKDVLHADGADVVIECVGNIPAVNQAFSAAKRGARILLFSVPNPEAEFPLPLIEVFKKELTIYGSFINPDTHKRAVDMINNRRLKLEEIITHYFPLEKTEEAIMMQQNSQSIKVIVKP